MSFKLAFEIYFCIPQISVQKYDYYLATNTLSEYYFIAEQYIFKGFGKN